MGTAAVVFAVMMGLSIVAATVNLNRTFGKSGDIDAPYLSAIHLTCIGVGGISSLGLLITGVAWIVGRLTGVR